MFEEGGDEANATVSRRHAHIRLEGGEIYLGRACLRFEREEKKRPAPQEEAGPAFS